MKTLTKLQANYTLGRRMNNELPLRFDPVLFAKQGRTLAGEIAVQDMPRISSTSTRNESTVSITMAFSMSSLHFPMVKGTIQGSIVQTCQRCLGDAEVKIDQTFTLVMINPESLELASKEGHEIYEYSGQFVSTIDMIEDEVILVMPIVVKHADTTILLGRQSFLVVA